jgi:hypothetical protein
LPVSEIHDAGSVEEEDEGSVAISSRADKRNRGGSFGLKKFALPVSIFEEVMN